MTNPPGKKTNILPILNKFANEGIQRAIAGLSEMVGDTLEYSKPQISLVPILEVPSLVGGPENECVGIYLRAEGEMAGQFMFILPILKALELVDMLMGDPPGTATELEGMGKSALAEAGNLTGSFFLNAIAALTGRSTVVSTPAVMFDMVGAILNIIVATSADVVDQVIMIRTNIIHSKRNVEASFWYVPDPKAIKAIHQLAEETA